MCATGTKGNSIESGAQLASSQQSLQIFPAWRVGREEMQVIMVGRQEYHMVRPSKQLWMQTSERSSRRRGAVLTERFEDCL